MSLMLILRSGQMFNFKDFMWKIKTLSYAALWVTEHIMQDKNVLICKLRLQTVKGLVYPKMKKRK